MAAAPVSPINSNGADLPVLLTAANVPVLPRSTPAVAVSGNNYNYGAQVVGAVGPNAYVPLQADPQGALYSIPEQQSMADAGAYYRAGTAIGTPIAYQLSAAYAATVGWVIIKNTAGAGGLRVYPDYARIYVTTAPVAGTACHYAVTMENANRYTSGGTAWAGTYTNMLSSVGTAGAAQVYAGVPVIAAAGATVRTVARGVLRTQIPVVGDQYVFTFGAPQGQIPSIASATASIIQVALPPVVLAANASACLILHLWFPSNITTPMSAEAEVGWWER